MACGILVPRPGIEPRPLAVKAPGPNHWNPPPGNSLREFLRVLSFPFSLDFTLEMNRKRGKKKNCS